MRPRFRLAPSTLSARVAWAVLLGLTSTWAAASAQGSPAGSPAGSPGGFHDVAPAVGIDFSHFNGMSGRLYFAEMTGAGGGAAGL